jgi:hypothetical protein
MALRSTSGSGGFRLRSRRTLDDRLKGALAGFMPVLNRPRVRQGIVAGAAVLLLAGGVFAFFALRPVPQPDYLVDDLDDVLGYTFLTDEFNRLPLDERLALVKDLVTRLKGMDSGDSALMAAFAAGIAGKAREQLIENVQQLAIDLWDDYAKRYAEVKPEEREKFLDDAFVSFTKTMEDLAGVSNTATPQERLAEGKRNAQRGQQFAKENDRGMNRQFGEGVFRMVDRGAQQASPAQQARMAQFSIEMTRHLRGQDVKTGKPK